MLFIGEDFILHGQVNARAVHQINDGEPVFSGNFLGAQILFAGDRKPGAGLYRGVVGHHDALSAAHVANDHHHTASRAAAVFGVHFITGESAHFDARLARVEQVVDALAGTHFAFLVEFFEALGRLLHKRLIKAISANSKVFFVADILTDEEISRRIELVTGSKPSLIFGVPASSLANLIGSYAAKADVEIAVEWKDDNASGDSEDYCLDGSDEWSSSSWGDTGDWSDSDSSF